jgi:NitT/TauT family transport system substrate-binding protein
VLQSGAEEDVDMLSLRPFVAAAFIVAWFFAPQGAAAEAIKVGVSKLASCSPIVIARDKGYFAAEGLEPDFIYFDAQQPIAVAAVSGDIDFGLAAQTAALYSLAGQGQLRVIAGGGSNAPTFHYLGLVASNHAYEGGLKSARDLPGHSVALTQLGTGLQYSLGLIADKYGFDVKRVELLPLQSNANIASALAGGRADASVFSSTGALPLIERGDVKLLGWIGDETGFDQAYLVFTATETADRRPDTVKRFLSAFKKGARAYHDAFTNKDDRREDGPTAPEMLAILAKYLEQPVERVSQGLPYIDGDGRLAVKDVARQIAWYKSQGLMKGAVSAEAIIDMRYVEPMPTQ